MLAKQVYRLAPILEKNVRLTPSVAGVWKWRPPFFSLNKTEEKVGNIVFEKIFITFHLERDTRSYYLNYILPLNLINLVTYSAFFLNPAEDDSLDIVLTTMLTVIAYMYILAGEVPKVRARLAILCGMTPLKRNRCPSPPVCRLHT